MKMKIKSRTSFNAGLNYAAHLIKFRGAEMLEEINGIKALDVEFIKILCKELSANLDEYSDLDEECLSCGVNILEFDE